MAILNSLFTSNYQDPEIMVIPALKIRPIRRKETVKNTRHTVRLTATIVMPTMSSSTLTRFYRKDIKKSSIINWYCSFNLLNHNGRTVIFFIFKASSRLISFRKYNLKIVSLVLLKMKSFKFVFGFERYICMVSPLLIIFNFSNVSK